jgi:hypothetical protein
VTPRLAQLQSIATPRKELEASNKWILASFFISRIPDLIRGF